MKKFISLLMILSMVSSLCPSGVFAKDTVYLVKEDFERFDSGAVPTGVDVSGMVYVRYTADTNKAVELSGNNSDNGITYKHRDMKKTVSFCVDMEYTDIWSPTSFYVKDSSGKSFELAYINENGEIYTGDGHVLTGFPRNRKACFQLTYNPKHKKLSVYVDGRCYMSNRYMGSNAFDVAAGFGITVGGSDKSLCAADNLWVFEGDGVVDRKYFASSSGYQYNGGGYVGSGQTDSGANEEFVSDIVYVNRTFDEDGIPEFDKLSLTPSLNKIELVQSAFDENKYIKLTKKEASESHVGFAGSPTERYHVVECSYSTDSNTPSGRLLYVRDGNAESMFNTFLNIKTNGNVETPDGITVAKIEPLRWTDIALIIDVKSLCFDVYVNKELKLKAVPFQNKTITALPLIRTGCDNSSSTGTLLIDNIKSYEGKELREIEEQKYGPITEQDNIPISYLGTKKAVHPYANTLFSNKLKQNAAYDIIRENDDTVIYVHRDDLKTLFGDGVVLSSAHLSVENYYNLIITANESGYCMQNMDTRLFVFDKTQPSLTENQLKSIQRYMYYIRPSADELKTLFSETSAGQHPRILINQDKLEQIKSMYKTDPLMKEWGDNVINEASGWFGRDVKNYQELLDEVDGAITNLALSYHLTGDERYAIRAWKFMEELCSMENWNPEHYLTTGEFTYIVGLGYDWLYDALSDSQRKYIEENLLEKGVGYTHKLYFNQLTNGPDGYLGWWQAESNWNAVCNGGTICGAMALMDVYPDICSELIENALKGLEGMLTLYYPHGTYEEGLSYWAYAFTYLSHAILSMRNSFGDDFNISEVPGLSETGWYVINLTGSTTVMTMGDVDSKLLNNPHIMFAADEYNDRHLMSARMNEMEKLGYEGGAFEMIYYNPDMLGEEINIPLDTYMKGAEAISLRERWYDKGAVYLGASGGENHRAHGHMDIGSYVVDMSGERFIIDIGAENYSAQGGYFTKNRYYFYRARPEGHNLYIINPEDTLEYYGMDPDASAKGRLLVSKPRGSIGIMDLSEAYAGYATKAIRGYMLTDDRRSVVVRDEIDLVNPDSTVHWFVHTKADVESVSGNQAVLKQNGKKILVTVDTNSTEWTLTQTEAKTLGEATKTVVTDTDNERNNVKKLALVAKGSGRLNITVKYKLFDDDMVSANPPSGDISTWTIPDGEITTLPVLDAIYIDGEAVEKFSPAVTGYSKLVSSKETTVPTVSVQTNLRCEIVQASDFGEDAIIKVYADENDGVYRVYRVNLYKLPPLEDVDGMRRYPVAEVVASEVPQPENGAENVIDNDINTRWAAEGTDGKWITLELDDVYPVEKIGVSWMSGTSRTTKYKLEISTDGINWTEIYNGASSGTTNEPEYTNAGGKTAKYVRCTGYGNSANNWNSLTEFVVLGNQR